MARDGGATARRGQGDIAVDDATGGAERKLAEAIHDQRLAEACAAILNRPPDAPDASARALAGAGRDALRAIEAEAGAAQAGALSALTAAGVAAAPGPLPPGAAQSVGFGIGIARRDLGSALGVAARLGYPLAGRLPPGAVAALGRLGTHLDLMREDAAATRMRLTWRARAALPRRLVPGPADLVALGLPAALWPAAMLARPLRVLRERLGGSRAEDRLGLVTAGANLATPEALIDPLLDLAGAGPGDLLVDLGCGDGRVLRAAARRGCRALGVERNAALAGTARRLIREAGLEDRAEIRTGPAGPADLRGARAAFAFLPGHVLGAALPGLVAALEPGARLVVHEQARLALPGAPVRSLPVFARNALTVAHLWEG